MATVTINGKTQEIGETATLLSYLNDKRIDPTVVVAEVNGRIVTRELFGSHTLIAGDTVELVRFVGGG
ncbi:MAG: sulfur carrier protein ThiS [Chitinispirillaceae bacterium]|nr:sulfur carrier protein ThiS [Chitinispirillaceae bacterium]